eukprot:TRINITY_DN19669_c0_g1_i2.p5 TRINITY_DN19669_c0_g1~~TRINITY_DN19669_c0_g1_i2.p5  ORF type:complete len:134 (+),score=1.66 TRINITY_DN19669_c0_g1_i2:2326-2727(+)
MYFLELQAVVQASNQRVLKQWYRDGVLNLQIWDTSYAYMQFLELKAVVGQAKCFWLNFLQTDSQQFCVQIVDFEISHNQKRTQDLQKERAPNSRIHNNKTFIASMKTTTLQQKHVLFSQNYQCCFLKIIGKFN